MAIHEILATLERPPVGRRRVALYRRWCGRRCGADLVDFLLQSLEPIALGRVGFLGQIAESTATLIAAESFPLNHFGFSKIRFVVRSSRKRIVRSYDVCDDAIALTLAKLSTSCLLIQGTYWIWVRTWSSR